VFVIRDGSAVFVGRRNAVLVIRARQGKLARFENSQKFSRCPTIPCYEMTVQKMNKNRVIKFERESAFFGGD
jgi:hypothetical protein